MTELEICNWALLKLGQRPLTSLEGERLPSNAVLCNTLLKPLHRAVLRTFAWSFAKSSSCLSPLDLGGEEVRYGLPKKCLKVLKIEGEGALKGDCIVTKERSSKPLIIEYIEEVSLSDCDPLYSEAIACKLASELCPTLTADDQLTLRLKAEFEKAKETAIDQDGIEIIRDKEY